MSAKSTPSPVDDSFSPRGGNSDWQHQRREKLRIALPNLSVKVRSSGFGSKGGATCNAIDISSHGFAFVSRQNAFKPLDKVQFTLSVGEQPIDGKGVICYAREEAGQMAYGVLFIATSQPVSSALGNAFAQPSAVEDYAVQAAENVWAAVAEDKINAQCLQQQYKLFSAISAFSQRLAQLEQDQAGQLLNDRLQLDEANFAIRLNVGAGGEQPRWVDIHASHDERGHNCFRIGPDLVLESSYEVIEYIAQLYRAG